jgi:hypothetical protein
MLTIVDEKIGVEKIIKAEAAFNVKQDRTFDDFTKQYRSHIEGHVDPNSRCADRPETVAYNPDKIRPRQKTNHAAEEEKIEYAKLMREKGKGMINQSVTHSYESARSNV